MRSAAQAGTWVSLNMLRLFGCEGSLLWCCIRGSDELFFIFVALAVSMFDARRWAEE